MERRPCPECGVIMKYCFPSHVRGDLEELASEFQRCTKCNWRGNVKDDVRYATLLWSNYLQTFYSDYGKYASVEEFLDNYRQ